MQVRQHQQAERELHVQEIQRLKVRLTATEKTIGDLMRHRQMLEARQVQMVDRKAAEDAL